MASLAEEIAHRHHLAPVTDAPNDHLAAAGWTIERMAAVLLNTPTLAPKKRRKSEVESMLAEVAIVAVLPQGVAQVPVSHIIELRKRHRDEMTEFQNALQEIVHNESALREIEDSDELRWHLQIQYDKRLKPLLEAYEKSHTLAGFRTRRGLISVLANLGKHAPTITGGLLTQHLASSSEPAGAGLAALGTLGFAAVRTLSSKSAKRRGGTNRTTRPDPGSYLFQVRRALTPTGLLQRVVGGVVRVAAETLVDQN